MIKILAIRLTHLNRLTFNPSDAFKASDGLFLCSAKLQFKSKLSDCFAELPILSWHSTPRASPLSGGKEGGKKTMRFHCL